MNSAMGRLLVLGALLAAPVALADDSKQTAPASEPSTTAPAATASGRTTPAAEQPGRAAPLMVVTVDPKDALELSLHNRRQGNQRIQSGVVNFLPEDLSHGAFCRLVGEHRFFGVGGTRGSGGLQGRNHLVYYSRRELDVNQCRRNEPYFISAGIIEIDGNKPFRNFKKKGNPLCCPEANLIHVTGCIDRLRYLNEDFLLAVPSASL